MSQRERFEQWVERTHPPCYLLARNSDDTYYSPTTRSVFKVWQAGARSALERAAQLVTEEIAASMGPTGGWLDSPKALCAAIVEKLRAL